MKESRGDEKALLAEVTCATQPHPDTGFEVSMLDSWSEHLGSHKACISLWLCALFREKGQNILKIASQEVFQASLSLWDSCRPHWVVGKAVDGELQVQRCPLTSNIGCKLCQGWGGAGQDSETAACSFVCNPQMQTCFWAEPRSPLGVNTHF